MPGALALGARKLQSETRPEEESTIPAHNKQEECLEMENHVNYSRPIRDAAEVVQEMETQTSREEDEGWHVITEDHLDMESLVRYGPGYYYYA